MTVLKTIKIVALSTDGSTVKQNRLQMAGKEDCEREDRRTAEEGGVAQCHKIDSERVLKPAATIESDTVLKCGLGRLEFIAFVQNPPPSFLSQ